MSNSGIDLARFIFIDCPQTSYRSAIRAPQGVAAAFDIAAASALTVLYVLRHPVQDVLRLDTTGPTFGPAVRSGVAEHQSSSGRSASARNAMTLLAFDSRLRRYAWCVSEDVLTLDGLRRRRTEILGVARKRRVRRIAVFGSVARGEAGPDSDVDLLVDFEDGTSLLDHVGLFQDLEDLLGVGVDVVARSALKPRDERIRAEAVDL